MRGADRGRRRHEHGLRPARAVSIDDNCKPIEKYGELGLFRAHEIPKITPIVVDKPGLDVACGAIGIGEITSIPTAPAIADAYFRFDGERRTKLPLANTPYERKG